MALTSGMQKWNSQSQLEQNHYMPFMVLTEMVIHKKYQ